MLNVTQFRIIPSYICMLFVVRPKSITRELCLFLLRYHIEANYLQIIVGCLMYCDLGGSAAKYLCEHLPKMNTDWSKWRIFFCDERHVSQTDPESTYGFYNKHLFSHVSVSKDHIFEDNTRLSGMQLTHLVVV